MKLEQTKRGARVKGIAGDRPVEIIASRFFSNDALSLHLEVSLNNSRTSCGRNLERILIF